MTKAKEPKPETQQPEPTLEEQLVPLLTKMRDSLAAGLENPGMWEPEWSQIDRKLVTQANMLLASLQEREQAERLKPG